MCGNEQFETFYDPNCYDYSTMKHNAYCSPFQNVQNQTFFDQTKAQPSLEDVLKTFIQTTTQ